MRSGRSGTVKRVGSAALSSDPSVRCSPAPRAEAGAKRPQSSAAAAAAAATTLSVRPGSEGDAQRGGKDEQRRPSTHRGTPRSSLRAGLGPDGRGGGVPRRALRSGPGRAYRLSVAAAEPTGTGSPCTVAEPSAERSPRPPACSPAGPHLAALAPRLRGALQTRWRGRVRECSGPRASRLAFCSGCRRCCCCYCNGRSRRAPRPARGTPARPPALASGTRWTAVGAGWRRCPGTCPPGRGACEYHLRCSPGRCHWDRAAGVHSRGGCGVHSVGWETCGWPYGGRAWGPGGEDCVSAV